MSIFVSSRITFETNITGEPLELRINNAVWVLMKSKFKLTQYQWAELAQTEETLAGIKFVYCVLNANGLKVTENEVAENTDSLDINQFMISYQTAIAKKATEIANETNSDESENDEDVENF